MKNIKHLSFLDIIALMYQITILEEVIKTYKV